MMTNTTQSNAREYDNPELLNKGDDVDEVGYTPEGWLNDFALACGYREQIERGREWINLDRMNDECYSVRYTNFANRDDDVWDVFDTVDQARKFFVALAVAKEMA